MYSTATNNRALTKKEKEANRIEAIEVLRKMLQPGQRVYTSLRHVSSNGMSRRIRVYITVPSEYEPTGVSIYDATYFAAWACGYRFNSDKGDIAIGGAGMDMGYAIVYSLSSALYRDNFTCIGEKCPSNDHANGDKEGYSIGHKHTDGGYALRHSWL